MYLSKKRTHLKNKEFKVNRKSSPRGKLTFVRNNLPNTSEIKAKLLCDASNAVKSHTTVY